MRTNRDNLSKAFQKLMAYYGVKDVAGMTEKFGVTEKNAAAWLKGYYDPFLLYRKCPGINAEWLLTGEGEMFKQEKTEPEICPVGESNPTLIECLQRENARLETSLHRAEERYDKLLEKFLEK